MQVSEMIDRELRLVETYAQEELDIADTAKFGRSHIPLGICHGGYSSPRRERSNSDHH